MTTASQRSEARWQTVEKLLVSVFSTLLVASIIGLFTLYSQVGVLQSQVSTHDRLLNQGRRYTAEDANSDRTARSNHEAAVLSALTEIQSQQGRLATLFAEASAKLESIQQEQRDAREERHEMEQRINSLRGGSIVP